ncbi:MAG: SOS response-associated peptidase [Solobacterium sp.]|nr:SOS response-associated peptidase [Solobacterium sp.]
MCGRYYIGNGDVFQDLLKEAKQSAIARFLEEKQQIVKPSGEIFPMDTVPVIAYNRSGAVSVFPMVWGYTMKGRSGCVINARAETAADKPMFRDGWKSHRCVIPASHYYEWRHEPSSETKKKTAEKYAIRPLEGGIVWLAGLYRMEEGIPHFVIVTKEPVPSIRFIHDRMPVMFDETSRLRWIHPDLKAEEVLQDAVTEVIFTPQETDLP